MKYIPLDAVLTAIEKMKDSVPHYITMAEKRAYIDCVNDAVGEIHSLEAKEVDLEKHLKEDIEDAVHGTVDFPLIGCDFPNIYPNYKELKEYCDRKGIKDNDKVKLIIIKDM